MRAKQIMIIHTQFNYRITTEHMRRGFIYKSTWLIDVKQLFSIPKGVIIPSRRSGQGLCAHGGKVAERVHKNTT